MTGDAKVRWDILKTKDTVRVLDPAIIANLEAQENKDDFKRVIGDDEYDPVLSAVHTAVLATTKTDSN